MSDRIETPEPNPGMLPLYSQELGEEFSEKPQGKPREFWLDLQCEGIIEIDDTNDCGDAVDLVRVREVNAEHDAWVKELIRLCNTMVHSDGVRSYEYEDWIANRIESISRHMQARPQ
jgi:hypothetical protein